MVDELKEFGREAFPAAVAHEYIKLGMWPIE